MRPWAACKGAVESGLDTVGIENLLRFFGDVEQLWHGVLHTETEFVRPDNSFHSFGRARRRGDFTIEVLNEVDLLALELPGCSRLDIRHHALVGDGCALIVGREKSAAVIGRAAERNRWVDGDVSGQVLVFGAEPVK